VSARQSQSMRDFIELVRYVLTPYRLRGPNHLNGTDLFYPVLIIPKQSISNDLDCHFGTAIPFNDATLGRKKKNITSFQPRQADYSRKEAYGAYRVVIGAAIPTAFHLAMLLVVGEYKCCREFEI